ncbi:MAG: PLP-dependent cysteine synthase family protein [Pseudomonadota bacterium]
MSSGILNESSLASSFHTTRDWVVEAISLIRSDTYRSADTHLHKLDLNSFNDVDIYLKDESTHATGSLKHRLARSLFLYGICNGDIKEDTIIVEASSGSTAISEAYFAKMLGLRFISVVPEKTSSKKLQTIRHYGGEIAYAEPSNIYGEAQRIANENGGYYMDQFTFAERVTDWRGNNNIAESIFEQISLERHPVPEWIVVGAGTGGTSATVGRYIRYQAPRFQRTKLCVADPEGSVFFDTFSGPNEEAANLTRGSIIEGVGRPRHEPSFVPSVVDTMMKVKDEASIATSLWLSDLLDRPFGGSTGLNVYASLRLACQMRNNNVKGSIVTLICDDGHRYMDTVHCEKWRKQHGLDVAPMLQELEQLV